MTSDEASEFYRKGWFAGRVAAISDCEQAVQHVAAAYSLGNAKFGATVKAEALDAIVRLAVSTDTPDPAVAWRPTTQLHRTLEACWSQPTVDGRCTCAARAVPVAETWICGQCGHVEGGLHSVGCSFAGTPDAAVYVNAVYVPVPVAEIEPKVSTVCAIGLHGTCPNRYSSACECECHGRAPAEVPEPLKVGDRVHIRSLNPDMRWTVIPPPEGVIWVIDDKGGRSYWTPDKLRRVASTEPGEQR